MSITNITDKEIALQAEVDRLKKEVSKLDVLLEECKMDWSGDVTQIKAERKREIEAMRGYIEKALIYLAQSGQFSRSSAKGELNKALTSLADISEVPRTEHDYNIKLGALRAQANESK